MHQVLLDACQSVPHLKIDAWLFGPPTIGCVFKNLFKAFSHLQGVCLPTTSKDVADLGVDFLVASSVSTQNLEA